MSQVLSFAEAYRRRNPTVEDIAQEDKMVSEEDKAFYAYLPSPDYPDTRLYHFAREVRDEPTEKRLDTLLVEAMERIRENYASVDAWFAKLTYQLAKDQPYGEALEQVLHTKTTDRYTADCIHTFLRFRKSDPGVKEDVARLVDDLLQHQPLERQKNDELAKEACRTILQLDDEELCEVIERQEQRRRFSGGHNA